MAETLRHYQPTVERITTVCFRVTRVCNLACPYCQAPPNGRQLTFVEMADALARFADGGTERIKFTGGEPFISPMILPLIRECRSRGMEPTIITNGTILPSGAIEAMKKSAARLKVSLHGPREIHDRTQGRRVFDAALSTIRATVDSGIETSIHTLVHRECELDFREWVEFLINEGIHKVSFMVFVPRGRGRSLGDQWGFLDSQIDAFLEKIRALATSFHGQIIVRCLDFARKPYLVFETDGRLMWEVGDESRDSSLLLQPTGQSRLLAKSNA